MLNFDAADADEVRTTFDARIVTNARIDNEKK